MDIGSKIKNARIKAKLTQEQVAIHLQVSRQTISNWETEKTYPDIVSVVKMSDLYNVSLDHLLKEDKPMSNYLNYLEESTDIVKSKNKTAKIILITTYLIIWTITVGVFWFLRQYLEAMGYAILYFYIILPFTTFIISLLIGCNNYWGKWKWCATFIFGCMYMLAEYATFSMGNMVALNKINMPDFDMILYGMIISVIGMLIGVGIRYLKSKFIRKSN